MSICSWGRKVDISAVFICSTNCLRVLELIRPLCETHRFLARPSKASRPVSAPAVPASATSTAAASPTTVGCDTGASVCSMYREMKWTSKIVHSCKGKERQTQPLQPLLRQIHPGKRFSLILIKPRVERFTASWQSALLESQSQLNQLVEIIGVCACGFEKWGSRANAERSWKSVA